MDIRSIGQRLKNVLPTGARFLRNAAGIGRRVANTGREILDKVGEVPIIGEAVRAQPFYETAKEGLRTVGIGADYADRGAGVLDQVQKGDFNRAFKDAGDIKSDFEKDVRRQKRRLGFK